MTPQKQCLYDPLWQSLRVQLLGKWPTVEGTKHNLVELQEWLDGHNWSKTACWQVLNLLNAVRMGYSGQGLKDSEQDDIVRVKRDMLQRIYERTKGDFEVLPKSAVYMRWQGLFSTQRDAVATNLLKRWQKHSNPVTRPELLWFLQTVRLVSENIGSR